MKSTMTLHPTSWARRLQRAVLYFAVAMIIGSILVGFVFENTAVMVGVFQRMGLSAAAAMQAASTFIVWYRLVAVLFCLFYVLGAYFSWQGKTWAFWYVILVFGVFGAGGVTLSPCRTRACKGGDWSSQNSLMAAVFSSGPFSLAPMSAIEHLGHSCARRMLEEQSTNEQADRSQSD